MIWDALKGNWADRIRSGERGTAAAYRFDSVIKEYVEGVWRTREKLTPAPSTIQAAIGS